MARDFLQTAGFQVTTPNSSLVSNHIIYGSSPPNLIIIDLMMPLMNGDHKIKTLTQSRYPGSPDVIARGRGTPTAGAEGIIAKPFTPLNLAGSARKYP